MSGVNKSSTKDSTKSEKDNQNGHRKRVREKYLSFGLDIFNDYEILEMLLFYVVPRKDTKDLAKELLKEFGSISAILDAPQSRLLSMGLTENMVMFFKFLPDIFRVYEESKQGYREQKFDLSSVCEYFKVKFIGRTEEVLYLQLLDSKMKNIYCSMVSKGDINSTDVPIRKIVEISLRYKAKYAIIAHNHPSGFAVPSVADLQTTKDVYISLSKIGVELLDHIIVSDNEQTSLYRSSYNKECFTTF